MERIPCPPDTDPHEVGYSLRFDGDPYPHGYLAFDRRHWQWRFTAVGYEAALPTHVLHYIAGFLEALEATDAHAAPPQLEPRDTAATAAALAVFEGLTDTPPPSLTTATYEPHTPTAIAIAADLDHAQSTPNTPATTIFSPAKRQEEHP